MVVGRSYVVNYKPITINQFGAVNEYYDASKEEEIKKREDEATEKYKRMIEGMKWG